MLRRIFRLLPLDLRTKKYLKYFYFRSMAALGLERFPALNNLDRKMLAYLPQRGGVFVEAGANDGVSQSNTWFLEAYRGWTGLLVEPVPELASLARRFRRAPVENVALGAPEQDGSTLVLVEADLMTTAFRSGGSSGRQISVPVRSLSALLDEHRITAIDFFSLDVEGFEIPVLKGLDLDRHAPKYMLIETGNVTAVAELLGPRYRLREALSGHDYLFERIS
ncbi:MAG: FkbM family methyltransferase [Pseudolabrys sp.]